ncbi:hypothetical protein IG631_04490 [Alternaria alternata]|nr:hypothetical protein IG631_04490 [Alternaria alternata]
MEKYISKIIADRWRSGSRTRPNKTVKDSDSRLLKCKRPMFALPPTTDCPSPTNTRPLLHLTQAPAEQS